MDKKGKKPQGAFDLILAIVLAAVLAVFVFGVMNS